MRWTLRSLCELAVCVTGVRVCCETMRRVVQSLGLTYKKAHKLLGKASAPRREEFVEQLGELVVQSHQDEGPLVVFADEAHIHLDTDAGYGWAPRGQRLYVNSHSPGLSHKRTCFGMYLLGATDPVQIHTASWATGETTCEMLTALRTTHPFEPLVLIWDNVRYHHSHKVRAHAEQLGIRLLYLPPYSPDLMPVERLWSWLRQDLTYLHTHRDEQELVDRIALFVAQLLDSPADVHRRLKPKLHLDPAEEKLRVSA